MNEKILVWLDVDLSRFGIIKSIQEKYECDLYTIIDVTKNTKDFFETQNIINFKKKWFYNDQIKIGKKPDLKYLKAFEKKFGINLWLLAYNERIFYHFNEFYKFNEDEILSILEQECRFFENVLEQLKPDYVIMQLTFFHHYQLFFLMCKVLGIKTLFLRSTRLGPNSLITEHYEFLDKKINEIPKFIQTIPEKNIDATQRGKNISARFLNSKKKLISAAINYLFFTKNNNIKINYRYFGRTKIKVLLNFLIGTFKTKYRKRFIEKNLLKQIEFVRPFVYYPLHIEQEHSLLTIAPFYTNQIHVIENLAKSLPIGYHLFVKEHPLMHTRNWRNIRDYKFLLDLPNVKLLHPSIDSKFLLKNCELVATISGTAALEAGFHKKPSIIFSDTMFSDLPFINRLKSFEDLPMAISKILNSEYDYDLVKKFVGYLNQNSFDVDSVYLSLESEDVFHHGGFFVDTKINEEKMKEFLNKHELEYNLIAEKFIERISKREDSNNG